MLAKTDPVIWLIVFLGIFVTLLIWMLPIYFARKRFHSKADAITVTTIVSLFIPIVWFVAIIWAFTEDNRASRRVGFGVVRKPSTEDIDRRFDEITSD